MRRLLLFDLDGTLIRSRNGYIPFNEAILDTFGVAGDIRSVIPDGNTDPLIVADIFAKSGIVIEDIASRWEHFSGNLRERYLRSLEKGITLIGALPGAARLLEELSSDEDFQCSVVTGNLEPVARVKLESAGLDRYLCRGAYGSDSPRRPDLPPIAKQRCEAAAGFALSAEDCIVIGDTPKDLEAARRNGMKCVLVASGRYPVDELLCYRADACLENLEDTRAVLKTLSSV